ncbi:3570_t:CDS:2 [Entrophospora sp. SA101]|nr:3570_t:CDS:2 [Entrophospora sp. SA101]
MDIFSLIQKLYRSIIFPANQEKIDDDTLKLKKEDLKEGFGNLETCVVQLFHVMEKEISELSKLRNGLIIKYCEEKEQRVRDSYWNFLNIINGCLSDKYLREYSDIFLLAIGTYP